VFGVEVDRKLASDTWCFVLRGDCSFAYNKCIVRGDSDSIFLKIYGHVVGAINNIDFNRWGRFSGLRVDQVLERDCEPVKSCNLLCEG